MRTAVTAARPRQGAAAGPEAYLAVRRLAKRFGSTTVLDSFDLTIRRGEFITLLGPSGCGKTTLLRLIAGLLRADSGHIMLDGRDLTRFPAHRRNVGMVFQSYALFPHLSVADNVAFGLKAKGTPRVEIGPAVAEALRMVRLEDLADRSIRALSGGQQQRVSLARAMAVRPSVMLLDEPFSSLDRKLREAMQIETRRILRRLGATAIFVTHDQEEALVLSDRVAVMNAGRAEHIGDPTTVYARPSTPFVLDFVGRSLKVRGRVASRRGDEVSVETPIGTLYGKGSFAEGTPVLLAVRPEHVDLAEATAAGTTGATLPVREIVFLGSKTHVLFGASEDDSIMAELPGPPPVGLEMGRPAAFSWPVEATILFREDA